MSRVLSQLDTYKTNNRRMPSANSALSTGCTTTVNKNDSGDVLGQVTTCNGRGGFIDDYLNGENFVDPDGEQYYIFDVGNTKVFDNSDVKEPGEPTNKPDHIIYYYTGATCQGETVVKSSGNGKNDVAIVYYLANGKYCGTNAEEK